MTHSRAWRYSLATGVVATVLSVMLPSRLAGDIVYCLIGLAAAGAVLSVAARRDNRHALPWLLIGLGHISAFAGDVIWTFRAHVFHVDAYPSVADGFYLLMYPISAAALYVVARRHGFGGLNARLDAAIVMVGVSLPYWVVLSSSTAADSGSAMEKAFQYAYPLGDMVLLAAMTWLLTSTGAQTIAFRMLTASVILMLSGNMTVMIAGEAATTDLPAAYVLFMLAHVLACTAALHPSATDMMRGTPHASGVLTTRRLTVLTVVVLLAPGTLIVQLIMGVELDAWAVAISSCALFLLVVARMATMLRAMEDQTRLLDAAARTDTLTGLPNRRTLYAQMAREHEAAARTGDVLCVAMIDLDRFKVFNDTYGHQAGDELLAGAARAWSLLLTARDMLTRHGGEEFVLLLPRRDLDDAERLLATLRAATPQGQSFSAGLARWDGHEPPLDLLGRADAALYAAKNAGRARTERAAPGTRASAVTGRH